MRIIHTALAILFVVAILVFCLQNNESVSMSYLGWSMSVPFPALILLVYLLGMMTGWSVLSFLRRSIRGARKKPE